MAPIPSDLSPFYKGGYETIPSSLAELRQLAQCEQYRMTPILKYKKCGSLLEIGPWRGVFSCNAKDAGFIVSAIEMDSNCVHFLRQALDIKVVQSSDPATALEALEDDFDVIALWHSLEHLPRPWLVIEEARRHLRVGGILIVAIPNIDSYQYRLLRGLWKHLDAPRHLFFYPIRSLIALCEQQGLVTLEVTTTDELSDALSKDTWHSLAHSIIPVRYGRGVLARMLRFAARAGEKKPYAGAGLTAVFQLQGVSED